MKSLKNKHVYLENKMSDMRIVIESTTEGLQKDQAKNGIKNSTIEEPNEKVCRITEEKMKMKSENDRSIGDLELSKKVAKDELLPQQEVAKAENLDENEREILRLRKESECNEVETEEKIKLISIQDKELKQMIRKKEIEIEDQVEMVK